MNTKSFKLLILSIPVFLLVISIIAFILNTRIAEGKPLIYELNPTVVSIGEVLEIHGRNFGDEIFSSKIFVSSIDILSRYIIFWSGNLIRIQIPEKARSGLVYLETERGMSEPVVLVLNNDIPFIGTGAYLPGLPFIETINPPITGPGAKVTVKGDNFGTRMNNSSILFTTAFSHERDTVDGDTVLDDFLEIPQDYVTSWDNNSISFYLPEFVETGDVFIKTESGLSNTVYFEKKMQKSGVILADKKTYMFHQSLTMDSYGETAGKVNIWFVSPVSTIYQRNLVILPSDFELSPQPCCGVNLYKINLEAGDVSMEIAQNVIVDVFEQNYSYDSSENTEIYDKNSPIYQNFTGSTALIPSAAARVKSTAASVTRRKNTDYTKARAIYDYVLARLTYENEVEVDSPDLVIDSKTGNSKAYSLLFSALARSSGIPARPVTGLFIDREMKAQTHWWAEFFLQGFGWFPVDTALADGMLNELEIENPVEYYWGNIDNSHIAFSRGEKSIPRLFPDGSVYKDVDYGLLTLNIETDSRIIELRSSVSDVKITAIY